MKNKLFNGISIAFGVLLLNGGANKFLNYMPVPDNLPEALVKDSLALVEIEWLMPLIAIAEITGGLLILFPKTRALGALVVFPVMIGVLLTHITVAPSGLPIAITIWGILLWILVEYRTKYIALIK
ncbi:MAG: DoxX family membrane protein [Cyclobacteriaceae bacterium]|nr:DoxX family membrane protein [Cyclobacteriaceae bacterium]